MTRCRLMLMLFWVALSLLGCSESERAKAVETAKTVQSDQALYVDLMVNGSPAPQLTREMPLVLTASIANPDPERAALLKGLAGIRPRVRAGTSERDTDLAWTSPAPREVELRPGATVMTAWVVEEGLAPGLYWIDLRGTRELAVNQGGEALTVRSEPLRLEVLEGPADPAQLAALRRRLLVLKGDKTGYLAAVRQALEREPDSHPLAFELVQGLDMNGDVKEARRELAGLIARSEARYQKDHPGQSLHLPSWYYSYLRELERRDAAASNRQEDGKGKPGD